MNYYVYPILKGQVKPEEPDKKQKIISYVCYTYRLTFDQLLKKDRSRDLVFARHLCMYLLRNQAEMSLYSIAKLFKRHHTSVIHAVRMIDDYLLTNSQDRKEEIQQFIHHVVDNSDRN